MSDEYQLRRDVNQVMRDVYDIYDGTLNIVPFAENSVLKSATTDGSNVGTLDAILEKYGLLELEAKVIALEERVRELEEAIENANQ